MKLNLLSWLAALSLVVVVAPGCGVFKKTQECKQLVETINSGVAKVKAIDAESSGGDAKKESALLKRKADTYEAIAADVKKVTLTVEDLKSPTENYISLLTSASKAARDISAAYEKNDKAKAEAGVAAYNKVVSDELAVVGKINKMCAGQ